MEIRELEVIVAGKRYVTAASTLVARERWPDEGDDDSGLATTLLFRTTKGNYFRQIQSHNEILRDQIEPILRDEAIQQFLAMPVKLVKREEAFPDLEIEDA